MASESRFGYEWNTYHWMSPMYERQFKNWTHPLEPKDWVGVRFLDAGCGMGRNSYWPLKWGAASGVAFDNDERSVQRAHQTLASFTNKEVLKQSIYDSTWHNTFDIAFSIGVIHHLKRPQEAVANMVEGLKPGGLLHVWVYSYEGNEWIVRYVDPIRIHITSKLPVALVHFLSYLCSIPLYAYVKLKISRTPYMQQLANFDFWHIHSIVFDQLIPTIAHYWTKTEVERLAENLALEDVRVYPTPEGTGWILSARKRQ